MPYLPGKTKKNQMEALDHLMDTIILSAFESWMVKSNLETIREGRQSADEIITTLKANGYPRIATAVTAAVLKDYKP